MCVVVVPSVCMYVYVYTRLSIYVFVYLYVCVYVCVCVCVCVCVRMRAGTSTVTISSPGSIQRSSCGRGYISDPSTCAVGHTLITTRDHLPMTCVPIG